MCARGTSFVVDSVTLLRRPFDWMCTLSDVFESCRLGKRFDERFVRVRSVRFRPRVRCVLRFCESIRTWRDERDARSTELSALMRERNESCSLVKRFFVFSTNNSTTTKRVRFDSTRFSYVDSLLFKKKNNQCNVCAAVRLGLVASRLASTTSAFEFATNRNNTWPER